ncbi:MAG: Hpt domain-containing protein [Longimicrobiales bacterium]
MTESNALDPAALERLREWGGDKLVGQMIRLFLENSQERMTQIRAGVDGDLDEAERGAHSLKSSAANVGAQSVRTIAAEMERVCGEQDAEAFLVLVPPLEEAYAAACAALQDVEKDTAE